ncbi:hypothetical protein GGQ84_001036 [Desulfitispora alkaliphila]|uniref:hypothetical protein n=1 Tax=Desulfitispora alkaliphila TaxID=622674 RepID=UPI003D1DF34B
MDIAIILVLIGTVTSVGSLLLYFYVIYSNKPFISLIIEEKAITVITRDEYGDWSEIYYKDKSELYNKENIDEIPENNFRVTLKVLLNNKGNKKATVNRMVFKTRSVEKEVNIDLIPLDVGESYMKEYMIPIKDNQEQNAILNEKWQLEITDNREEVHTARIDF